MNRLLRARYRTSLAAPGSLHLGRAAARGDRALQAPGLVHPGCGRNLGPGLRLQPESDRVARPVGVVRFPRAGGLASGIRLDYRAVTTQDEFPALGKLDRAAPVAAACGCRPRASFSSRHLDALGRRLGRRLRLLHLRRSLRGLVAHCPASVCVFGVACWPWVGKSHPRIVAQPQVPDHGAGASCDGTATECRLEPPTERARPRSHVGLTASTHPSTAAAARRG